MTLNANQLKLIALLAMTIDHVTSVCFPNYSMDWWIVGLHIIGRLAAPIFCFCVVEGFYHTHNLKKYIGRLFMLAIVSHFAYNFAFGIPFRPFQTSIFNQTSIVWALAFGLVALLVEKNEKMQQWQKTFLILGITVVTFAADWSSIAVLTIINIGANRGNFARQMSGMMLWVAVYAAVYAVFINPVYGFIQLFVALSIPLLKRYNGKRGNCPGMKWLFYVYYPLHLLICGLIRILLHGNISVMIGG